MSVAETKMLRLARGDTMDKIENKETCERTKVTEVHKQIQEKRLKWYCHVMR